MKNHQEFSGKKLEYVDTVNQERFIPYVVETSGGVTRSLMAFLCNAYNEDEAPDDKGNPEKRVVLKFHPKLSPVIVAVFPLVNKDGMPEYAQKIYKDLHKNFRTQYDTSGAIGRRYRRQDEIGTPFCVTVDGQTLQDNTVTIRERDTMIQERIQSDSIREYLNNKLF